jgi:CRISPR/Cas system CSM-associated protein Csm4 (group 5 of RAMP superfamily)
VTDPTPEPAPEPAPEPRPAAPGFESAQPHWLLSLYTPASSDAVDWRRGNYSLVTRGGRVDSPTASGDLKQHLQMVSEGSVLMALTAPSGSAPDVAPSGLAHPVYRAGFAVAIPLPEAPPPARPAAPEAL